MALQKLMRQASFSVDQFAKPKPMMPCHQGEEAAVQVFLSCAPEHLAVMTSALQPR